MLRLLVLILALAVGAPSAALAQGAVQQGGPWTQGHAPMYVGNGSFGNAVIQDSGPAGGGGIGIGMSEGLYVAQGTGTAPFSGQGTGPLGTNWCDYDAPITNPTGFHYLCFSPNISGAIGAIVYGNNGLAAAQPLAFNVDAVQQFQLSALGTNFTAPILFNGSLPSSASAQTLCENSAGVLSFNCASGSGGGTPGGATNAVQYNCAGSFCGIPVLANAILFTTGGGVPSLGTQGNLTTASSLASATMPVFISTGAVQQATIGTLAAGNAISITGTSTVTVAGTYAAGTGINITGPTIALNGTLSGNGTVFATSTGSLTSGHCVSINSGNFVDAGGACTTGGGGGTVSSGLINQLAYYASAGTVVSGLATAASGVLVTSAGSVPSISTTLPGGLTFSGTTTITTLTLTNPLTTANGGSGIASPTAHSLLQAEGASIYNLITAATAGRIVIDQGAGADWLPEALSGDCTLVASGAITCTKTSGVAFGTFATQNFATPPTIGGTTPAPATFSALTATGNLTTNISGSTQCVQASSAGVLSGAGQPCGAPAVAGGRLVAMLSSCGSAPDVQFSNISAAAVVCYVPFLNGLGNIVTVAGTNYVFTTLTLALNASFQLTGNLYDVFMIARTGAAVICVDGLAWSSISVSPARADAISQAANGLWVNNATVNDCYNGATDFGPLSPASATYLGTIYASANGQTIWVPTPAPANGGPTGGAVVGVYNAYNRVTTNIFMGDNTANFAFAGTGQWQNFGASLNERISYVDGLGRSSANFYFKSDWSSNAAGVNGGGTSLCIDGIGNAPSAPTCQNGGPGTTFAPTSTSWETDAQISNSGSATGVNANIAQHWLTMLGFHFAQTLWVTASGQHVNVSCGNNGAICQMHAQIPM